MDQRAGKVPLFDRSILFFFLAAAHARNKVFPVVPFAAAAGAGFLLFSQPRPDDGNSSFDIAVYPFEP
jgi:hypothetical protein